MNSKFIVLILLLFFNFQAYASNTSSTTAIDLDNSFLSIKPSSQVRYIEDAKHQRQKEDIFKATSEQWQAIPNPSASFGFSKSVFWFKFSLNNIGSNIQELYVHIDYALLDKIQLYQVQDNTVIKEIESGDQFPFNHRPVAFPTFLLPIEIAAHTGSDIYIRVETRGSLHVPISVWSKNHFLLDSQSYLFLYGCFLSAMLIMAVYNFCLFLTIRDKHYLLYSVFILVATGVHSSLDGFAYQWFWPDSPYWHQVSSIFFIAAGCFVTTLFTQALLPIPKRGPIRMGITFLIILTACSALMSLALSYRHAALLNSFTTLVSISGIILICLAMIKHSGNLARYFIFAWCTYFVGIILKSSSNIALIESNFLSEYAGNIGAVIAVLIMSLALAERINMERRSKERAQSDSINHLSRFERLYKNALEGVFTFNLEGRLLSANPAFYKQIGFEKPSELEPHLHQAFNLSTDRFNRLLTALRLYGRVSHHETTIASQTGINNWINISARLAIDHQTNEEVIEGTLININERKAAEDQLKHLANHDSLTGLVNRRVFEENVKAALKSVKDSNDVCCLLYLDLDQFKIVNDLCGHSAGDVLLKNLSQRLARQVDLVNKQHIIARLGGDEFGILLNKASLITAQDIAEQIRQSIEEFLFVWQGNRFSLGVSIGLVELLPFHHSVEQVLVMADTACYLAKDQGRNRVHTFVESDRDLEFRQLEMQWVSDIKQALSDDSFFLVFQNIVPNQTQDERFHYEILLRLINKQGNLCAPGQFLSPAERYSLMSNIDRWVIKRYFSWLHENPEHLEQLSCASINLSTKSIGDDSFSTFLTKAFEDYAIPYDKICFEITESMAITHIDNTHIFIDKFRERGCRFALDDFGTGFSSYAYLKELQVDYLKIDGMFIKNLSEDVVNLAMVKSISDVASAIGIETIAEFVETETVKKILSEIGITYSQGHYIHKPVKLDIRYFDRAEQQSKSN